MSEGPYSAEASGLLGGFHLLFRGEKLLHGLPSEIMFYVDQCNAAYAEGYKAGRASRDGLVEKMKRISYGLTLPETDMERAIRKVIEEALAEDEKEAADGK